MKEIFNAENRRLLLFCCAVFGLIAVFVILPNKFHSQAGNGQAAPAAKIQSYEQDLENYDIRKDKRAETADVLEKFRQSSGKNAQLVFETDKVAHAENALRQKVPNLKIERNEDLKIPEIVAPDVKNGRASLTPASNQKRPDVLRGFIKQNKELFGLNDAQETQLEQTADYTNPDGNLSFTRLEQKINDVPVFRGEVKAAFTKRGEIVRVLNNLAPDLDNQNISTDFGNALDAVKSAAANLNYQLKSEDLTETETASTGLKRVFGRGEWATTAEKMYFPTEKGVARAAWRVLVWENTNAYYVIVDAETGAMLWRKNITEEQTQPATFSVYTNANAMINVARNPFPLSPGAASPNLGTQGAAIGRTTITRVGNEAPYAFNNKGWIADGGTQTEGNAVEAGIDRDGVNGVDPQGRASGSANRSFVFDYAPGNPNTNSGDAPYPSPQTYPISAFQSGAVTQLFYITNWYHDETYRLGFTEAAFNFQNDNFGRGGAGNDRISAEAQDSSATNNANFSVPADGGRGRMQMYLWSSPNPNFDGSLDADIVVHELTHGLSNRLHGNSSGLHTNMAGAMGEGWSDFYALAMLSQPSDPIDGIYTIASYATYLGSTGYRANNYYGIRRFPTAIMSAVGANGKPHSPLTFRDLNPNCNQEIGTPTTIGTISAFPRGSFGATTCDEVHVAGEIWSSALWEVRAKFVSRLGWEIGNRRILQLVTDGMKLAPMNPTFLQERDAIIAAAQASGSAADVDDIWAGFAIRGMGFGASVELAGAGYNNASVTEAFDLPNLVQTPNFTINDSAGNNNGSADPNETILLNIPLKNTTGKTATNVTLQIGGAGTANYGDIQNNQIVTRAVSFSVPAGQSCASLLNLTFNINSSLGARTERRDLLIGKPNTPSTFVEKFDSVTAPTIPSGWTVSPANPNTGSSTVWETSSAASSSAPIAIFAPDPTNVYQAQIESPPISLNISAAKLKFKINYNTEAGWDGTTLDIKIGAGAYRDIIEAGGKFISGAYPGYIAAGAFPNSSRKAWTGNSNGFVDVEIYLPASAQNQTVQFRWNASADTSVGVAGTYIDDVEVIGSYLCDLPNNLPGAKSKARGDFDGDGKTDLSVFRLDGGNWFVNRSRDGFSAVNWGISTDLPMPSDFDGDGKADQAVYRPSNGVWYILRSSDANVQYVQFGTTGDKNVAADYDGDGKTDVAVYRPSNGTWFINRSRDGFASIQFGNSTDVPVPLDYDGDGKTDVAVYRDGTWIINQSGGGVQFVSFGLDTDKPVPADYDGDHREDVAVFRPSNGAWYILRSTGGFYAEQFGISTDSPVPGDYDGDGKSDVAVYRDGTWFISASTAGFSSAGFGIASDIPIPKQYIP